MDTAIGNWGLYQWFEEHGLNLIHPDDLVAFRQLTPNGKLFEVVGFQDGYWMLRYAQCTYRVKPALFKNVPAPPLTFGDQVRIFKSGAPTSATIGDIMWHFQKAEPFYRLTVNEKLLKKRYWLQDFLAAEE
ncbi:DUF6960 family protein [Aeoliella sp. SH292]|uniref:DUF6960 family protein n=1 Tax=Aeoliella sp. SH292 TaxID=3454464 RepID=UPI003F9D68BD